MRDGLPCATAAVRFMANCPSYLGGDQSLYSAPPLGCKVFDVNSLDVIMVLNTCQVVESEDCRENCA